jgi:DNA-binding transcriptional ArsR family regulator
VNTLADDLELSRTTIHTHLNTLEACGYIRIDRNGYTSNTYTFLLDVEVPPEFWCGRNRKKKKAEKARMRAVATRCNLLDTNEKSSKKLDTPCTPQAGHPVYTPGWTPRVQPRLDTNDSYNDSYNDTPLPPTKVGGEVLQKREEDCASRSVVAVPSSPTAIGTALKNLREHNMKPCENETNPRAVGLSPRQIGANPRAMGTNPRYIARERARKQKEAGMSIGERVQKFRKDHWEYLGTIEHVRRVETDRVKNLPVHLRLLEYHAYNVMPDVQEELAGQCDPKWLEEMCYRGCVLRKLPNGEVKRYHVAYLTREEKAKGYKESRLPNF